MTIRIEIIAAPGCAKCLRTKDDLRAVAVSLFGEANLHWREVNVLEELDYAVSLGVLSMPAIAIDGTLRFMALPTTEQFKAELTRLALS